MTNSVMPDSATSDVNDARDSIDDEVEGAVDAVLAPVLQLRPGNHIDVVAIERTGILAAARQEHAGLHRSTHIRARVQARYRYVNDAIGVAEYTDAIQPGIQGTLTASFSAWYLNSPARTPGRNGLGFCNCDRQAIRPTDPRSA